MSIWRATDDGPQARGGGTACDQECVVAGGYVDGQPTYSEEGGRRTGRNSGRILLAARTGGGHGMIGMRERPASF